MLGSESTLGLRLEVVEALDPEIVEKGPDLRRSLAVGSVEPAVAVGSNIDEIGIAQYAEVLARQRLAHPEPCRDVGDCELVATRQSNDLESGRVTEDPQELGHLVIGERSGWRTHHPHGIRQRGYIATLAYRSATGYRRRMNRNPEVEQWLQERGHPLDAALRAVRDVVLGSDDRVTESIKWKTPTFEYKGNIASFSPSKQLISLMFHRGAEIPGEHEILEGDARLVRTARFASIDEVDDRRGELETVIQAWCDWRDS